MLYRSLRVPREELGLTQKAVAKKIGISKLHYYRCESGYCPSERTRKRICNFYTRRGRLMLEEDVFPEELRPDSRRIPEHMKDPLHSVSERLLPRSDSSRDANPEYAAMQAELSERVNLVLKSLSPRQEKVIRMRFGIGESYDRKRTEVADEFEVTPEYIRQVEMTALRRLRNPVRAKELEPFWED